MPCYLQTTTPPTFKLFKNFTLDPDDFMDLKNKYKVNKDDEVLRQEYEYYLGYNRPAYIQFIIKETIAEMKKQHHFLDYNLLVKHVKTPNFTQILADHNRPYIPFRDFDRCKHHEDLWKKNRNNYFIHLRLTAP